MAYARGKYAKFISDRSGMEFPYTEMVKEWNGSRVHKSEFEPKSVNQKSSPFHYALPTAIAVFASFSLHKIQIVCGQ